MVCIDRTPLFRARAKLAKSQSPSHKKVQQDGTSETGDKFNKFCDNSRGVTQNYANYSFEARKVLKQVTSVRDLILSKRKNYICNIGHSPSLATYSSNAMNDWERSQLDANTETTINTCINCIHKLQLQLGNDQSLRINDERPHFIAVLQILCVYVKNVTKVLAELQSIRAKKMEEKRQIFRLATLAQTYAVSSNKSAFVVRSEQPLMSDIHSSSTGFQADQNTDTLINETGGLRRRGKGTAKEDAIVGQNDGWTECISELPSSESDPSSDTSPQEENSEERIQLIAENEHLYSRFLQLDDDIQRVEKQMLHVRQLQETLAEKVTDQEKDINSVNELTVLTTENIRSGNEQIRLAIQNMASRRVILLFCIIVLTFTLLFIDWYKP